MAQAFQPVAVMANPYVQQVSHPRGVKNPTSPLFEGEG